ncbi:MAG: C40 family peptidase [Acidobacteria bacterium]|nr:C40 family peptidase [Acidobacteriota bacterium]
MKPIVLALLLLVQVDSSKPEFWDGIRAVIQKHLGRPYVWGATGVKSFDCSGFIWRVMYENGILMKRTTARKFYMILPKASKEGQASFGTLVFFDDLKHVGIIDNAGAFYHAQVSLGTNRSNMTPFWKRKIYGFRKIPAIP